MRPRDFPLEILEQTAHRPWPMPDARWAMTQTWHDLLFAHWPVEPDTLARHVPRELPLDLFDGRAWVGIVPFRMTNVALRGMPALPWISAFPELNVRTYVRLDDRPGVYFFSLDAGNPLAVAAARLLHLPYYVAAMHVEATGAGIAYASRRRVGRAAELAGTYQPAGPVFTPTPGSLDYFLTERYCLYTVDSRRHPLRLEIHHPPWALQPAEAELTVNTMARAVGLDLPPTAPLLHFARRQDAVAWMPARVDNSGGRPPA